MNKRGTARFITRAGVVAALYVVLTYLSALCGLSIGIYQFRISEVLCILPVFMVEAIPGLAIGCLIANMISGSLVIDVIFGSIATLIGAIGAYLLRKLPNKLIWLSTLPNVIANTLIIPPILVYVYRIDETYLLITFAIFVSQFVTAGIGGTMLYPVIKKSKLDRIM